MPIYATECEDCKSQYAVKLSFDVYDSVKNGSKVLECQACGGNVHIQFSPRGVDFILTDGPSGGWQSKALKENKYRAGHQQVMARRERDHVFKNQLVPNYNGVELGSWKEAKEVSFSETLANTRDATLAKSVASTYEPLVVRERQQ